MVLKDFTFHDGTVAPKGSTFGINTHSIHHDAQYYPDPDTFKPFRFVTENKPQKLAVAPSLDYHAFGIGRPAWCVPFYSSFLNNDGPRLIPSLIALVVSLQCPS